MTDDIQSCITQFSENMHRIETLIEETTWDLATTGSDADRDRLVELEIEYRALFADAQMFGRVRDWYEQRAELKDGLLSRQLTHLYLSFVANYEDPNLSRALAELSAVVESRFMNFRAVYQGRQVSDNEIREILKTNTDSDRVREAWEASKQVGRAVYEDVSRLAEMRNQGARALGYETHYARALAAQEIAPDYLSSLLDAVERETREPYRRLKAQLDQKLARRFGVSETDLRPWHYGEPFFQEPPSVDDLDVDELFAGRNPMDLARSTFTGLGMEVEDILARSDLYEREHKDQHAFCTHIDRMSGDVRILCNLRPNKYWTTTILHELGHAVYDKYLDPTLPYLLHDIAHISTTEAIAMLMGRLTNDPTWMTSVMSVPADKSASLASLLTAQQRLGMLIFMRWALVVVRFEQALYANPRRDDLNRLWWDLVERFQMLRRPDSREEPDWAAKIHIALYPAYYQNYMLGELTASQLQRHILQHFGGLVNVPAVGDFLRDRLFKLGAEYPWNETLRRATGEPLQPRYFAEQFAG